LGKSYSTFTLVNEANDTIKTGIPIPAKGNTVVAKQPIPKKAAPFAFKQNSFQNLKYLDTEQGLPATYVWSVLHDSKDNIWFGTNGGGVTCYNGKGFINYSTKEGLPGNTVIAMIEDHNGNIWMGTSKSGVTCFNGKEFITYSTTNGLSNNTVKSLIEDKNDNIWAGTASGLNLLTKNINSADTNYSIITFDKQDGLKSLNFIFNSVWLDSKNQIWWGTAKSIVTLDANNYKISSNKPVVKLIDLNINDESIDFRNITNDLNKKIKYSEIKKFNNYPDKLIIPYKKNHIKFIFSATEWSAPHKILYSYKMEGLDNSWSYLSKETQADYRNLPYGIYTFKIKALSNSQIWSDTFEYTFTVDKPWWHTWWARSCYLAILGIFILIIVKWRTYSLKQQQKELERTVKERTVELSEAVEELNQQAEELQVLNENLNQQNEKISLQRDKIETQKHKIEEIHFQISESINYAKHLQESILPETKSLKDFVSDVFVFFKPKDNVSGDFYWWTQIENHTVIAVSDCTGHGVP